MAGDVDVKLVKNNLRSKYKSLRMSISKKRKFDMDMKVYNNLLSTYEYMNCSVLFTYVSKKLEVDTLNVIKSSIDLGKRVAVPRCKSSKNEMEFYFINSLEDLILGAFDILEPRESKSEKVEEYPEDSLCLVPGLAFDFSGQRIGYGKGYYDRFLENYKGNTAGLCYSVCVRRNLPVEEKDKCVKILVTDENVIKVNMRGDKKCKDEI